MKNYLCVLILGMLVLPVFSQDEPPTSGDTSEVSDDITDLMKRAEQGDAFAQNNLGAMYGRGEGVSQDYKEAFRWYGAAAKQGISTAQYNLGNYYSKGTGVLQDYQEAVRWYLAAAEQGDPLGQNSLGFMYEHGTGVPQDYKEAVRWYRAAAEQGNAVAQTNLGLMYEDGKGVAQDYIQAHMWYNLAGSSGGNEDRKMAATNRDLIAEEMTSEQIAEAQRLAREWKPKTGSQ